MATEEKAERPSKCRGCGAPMIWGQMEDGTWVPLDPKPAVYRLVEFTDLFAGAVAKAVRQPAAQLGVAGGFAVSHFATCPKASDFSRSQRA